MRKLIFGRKYGGIGAKKVLDLPLQNNFDTGSSNSNYIVPANSNGLPSFVAGPKGTDYAVNFTGTKSLKTALNLAINTSDKVSISFWMKTTMTDGGMVAELSVNSDVNNAFYIIMNNATTNYLSLRNRDGSNYSFVKSDVSGGSWKHIVCIIDRNLASSGGESKIYVNKILTSVNVVNSGDVTGNFDSYPLFIGQRNGSTYGFIGQLAYLKIFNYALTQTEIDNLYNE